MTRRFALLLLLTWSLFSAVITNGSKAVTAAGTAEALSATSVRVSWVTVQALVDNTTNVFVGAASVEDGLGVELAPGDSHHFPIMAPNEKYDLAEIYVDAATNGEGVSWVAGTR